MILFNSTTHNAQMSFGLRKPLHVARMECPIFGKIAKRSLEVFPKTICLLRLGRRYAKPRWGLAKVKLAIAMANRRTVNDNGYEVGLTHTTGLEKQAQSTRAIGPGKEPRSTSLGRLAPVASPALAMANNVQRTLNIVALGLANLIGGLFVIAHNLREIRKEQVIGSDQNEERLDRYQETLGRRENLRRHVVAAVLSYIIFGLIPPTVYGFSFRQSDNREYKMIAVAAASLACIALLAIGKAHVGRAPRTYFKTLSFYISIGVTGSGISYVAGQLLNQLLEKLGLFDSSSPASPASIFLDSNSSTGLAAGWASS
ncbi:hypothetical protein ACLOJK_032185 [Asimina triloba]